MNPAPPVTSSLTHRLPSSELHVGVVAEHETHGVGPPCRAGHLHLLAQERVDDGRDADYAALLEHDRVLDLRSQQLAAVVDGGEGAHEAVLHARALADDGRASDGAAGDLGAGLDHHPPLDEGLAVDAPPQAGLPGLEPEP